MDERRRGHKKGVDDLRRVARVSADTLSPGCTPAAITTNWAAITTNWAAAITTTSGARHLALDADVIFLEQPMRRHRGKGTVRDGWDERLPQQRAVHLPGDEEPRGLCHRIRDRELL